MDAKIEHKYFDLVREEYVDGKKRTIRRCKICQRDYKGTASVNSNFITHLKHVHPELLHDWARKKAERAEKATNFLARHQGTSMLPYGRNYLTSIAAQVPKAEFLTNPLKHEALTPTTLTSLANLGQTDADRQVAVMRSVLNYLVMDIQPASVINRKGFRNLVRSMHPFFGLPTATQIRDTLIPSAYEHVRDSITSTLSLVPIVNLQISVISNCFVAVTAYYLNVYWELKHHLLTVFIISPGVDWAPLVEQTKQQYGITNKIFYEKVNRLALEDFTKYSKFGAQSKPDNEPTSSEGESDSPTVETDTSFAYVITKVIHQALNHPKLTKLLEEQCGDCADTVHEGVLFTPWWTQVLAKLRTYIGTAKTTPLSNVKLEPDTEHDLISDLSPFAGAGDNEELAVAIELVDILEPFEEVYNLIAAESSPSVGIVVPSILSLDQLSRDMRPTLLADLATTLNTSLQTHLAPMLKQKYYQVAAALDPRFKMKWCRGAAEEGNVQSLLEEVAAELRISNPSPSAVVTNNNGYYRTDENNESKSNEQATKRRKLFSFLERQEEKDCKPSSALLVEFNDFVREQLLLEYECPFRYWQEKSRTYSCLAQLVYYLCSIPACPPPVDKVFLEWTVNSFQQCNSSQELERLFFLNVNSSLW